MLEILGGEGVQGWKVVLQLTFWNQYPRLGLLIVFENDRFLFRFQKKTIVFKNDPLVLNF